MAIPAALKSRVAAIVLALSTAGAIGLIGHEGMRPVAYKDPVGIVTVCAGHTATAKLGQVKTEAECAALLQSDVKDAEQAVKRLVTIPLTQKQFDALVSFTFNVGSSNLAKSTLLRKINANDCWGAGHEFSRWNKAGKKWITDPDGRQVRVDNILPGLTKRRADERKHWETGCAKGNYSVKADQIGANKAYEQVRLQARRPEYAFNPLLARTPQQGVIWQ